MYNKSLTVPISIESGRVNTNITENGEYVITKCTSFIEYENYLQAKNLIREGYLIKIEDCEYLISLPERIEWNSISNKLELSLVEGDNLEILLRDEKTYPLAQMVISEIFKCLVHFGVFWLDFAPRNILISKEQRRITLIDFEKGIYHGNHDEYCALVLEEYSLFLKPNDNLFYSDIESLISKYESTILDHIVNKSKRINVLYLLFEKRYTPIELYIALIQANCPIVTEKTTYFPIVESERILAEEGYTRWAEFIARKVEYHVLLSRNKHNLIEYTPFGIPTNLTTTDDRSIMFYSNKGIKYQIDLEDMPFKPKSGTILLPYIEDIINNNTVRSALDIGTGPTAFLGRHISVHGIETVDAIDVDDDVLKIAQTHLRPYETNLHVFHSNIYQELNNETKYDLIVSNPPQMPAMDGLHLFHDASGKIGRDVPENIIRNAAKHLASSGHLLLLLFEFLGVDYKTNSSLESLADVARASGLIIEKAEHIRVPVRPGGGISRSINLIKSLYPESHITSEWNEIVVLQCQKPADIGIVGFDENIEAHEGYLKFCHIYKDSFVFREEFSGGKSSTLFLSTRGSQVEPSSYEHIVDQLISKFDGARITLCTKPAILYVDGTDEHRSVSLEQYPGTPLAICENEDEIAISFLNGDLLILTRSDLKLVCQLPLHEDGYIEPYYLQFIGNNLLITDASAHVVRLINRQMKTLWEYGTKGCPGTNENELCVPVSAIMYDGSIYISEQRSHRVIKIDPATKHILQEWGTTNIVGGSGDFLWAPQFAVENGQRFLVMCKAANICIYHINSDNSLSVYLGQPLFERSLFNFPRACEYSIERKELVVCDTYHDRICIFDANQRLIHEIDNSLENIKLHWPRCAKWIGKELLVANSTSQEIICFAENLNIHWRCSILDYLYTHEWIQSVDMKNNCLLVLFETFLVIIDINLKEVVFNSINQVAFSDAHYAYWALDDTIYVADTGNNRIVVLHKGINQVQVIDHVILNEKNVRLRKPRSVLVRQNDLIIVNSQMSQILVCDRTKHHVKGVFGKNRGMDYDRLSIPRWISSVTEDLFYISDTDNHRIILRQLPV